LTVRTGAGDGHCRVEIENPRAMKIVVAMKVRDERDVIEANLRYHYARGADQFIVTDNGSSDGTEKVLRRYEKAGLLRLISEPEEKFNVRDDGAADRWADRWVTRMARLAASEMNADWVIHIDADEFWWPVGGSLKDALAAVPDEYGVLVAPRPEFVARPEGPGEFWERLTVRDRHSQLMPKIAHRAEANAVLGGGAHDVEVEPTPRTRSRGSAVLRGVREESEPPDERLVWAPVFPARVLHLPVRSFVQYTATVERLLRSGRRNSRVDKLRRAYEQGRLRELYDQLVLDDEAVTEGIREGRLVEDTGLQDLLPRCPDPTEGAYEPPVLPGEDAEHELAEIRYDAMRSLTRAKRSRDWTISMKKRNIRAKEERIATLRDRLAKVTDQA
jgi:hypothetical protein